MWQNLIAAALTMAQQLGQGAQQQAAAGQQQQQQDWQAQMLRQQSDQQARQQRDLLKRQLASNRAALAGGGVGFAGGSGAALLAGLSRQTEQDIADDTDRLRWSWPAAGGAGVASASRAQDGLQKVQDLYGVMRPLFER
jgi:hypothetical protein